MEKGTWDPVEICVKYILRYTYKVNPLYIELGIKVYLCKPYLPLKSLMCNLIRDYCSFNQVRNFSIETDSITIGIELCNIPQISLHCGSPRLPVGLARKIGLYLNHPGFPNDLSRLVSKDPTQHTSLVPCWLFIVTSLELLRHSRILGIRGFQHTVKFNTAISARRPIDRRIHLLYSLKQMFDLIYLDPSRRIPLLWPPPLETVRAPFNAYGLSPPC